MCVKESKLKTSASKNEMEKNTTNYNSLMQVFLAMFGSFGIETTVYTVVLLFTHSQFQLPQSQI